MLKLFLLSAVGAMAALAPAAAAQAVGPDAAACRPNADQPAILVNVTGFKAQSGRVRVQAYGTNPADFLAKGKYVRRIDLPVSGQRMMVCVAVPNPGNYAIAVRHDVDGNGKKGDWGDGGGFSRNPELSLFHLKPSFKEVAVPIGRGVRSIDVVLNYRKGISIGPVSSS
jgi:uncharacterized protein (DUF2141 family)